MAWTDLLREPKTVTGLYGRAPSLLGFKLEGISLGELSLGGHVTLSGDLKELPNPTPARWIDQRKTRAYTTFYLYALVSSEVHGIPLLQPNGHFGFEGRPVDLRIESENEDYTTTHEDQPPSISISGQASFLTFRFVCASFNVQIRGREPHVY